MSARRAAAPAGRLVPIESVVEGMTTAEPVKDRGGRLLMPSGTVLEASHLRALSRWGISSITVELAHDAPEPAASAPTPERIVEAELALKSVFRRVDLGHPLIHAVFSTCVYREATRGEGGRHG